MNRSTDSMSPGVVSMRIPMTSMNMGTVVSMTRIEKRKVQIGSAIVHVGLIYIIIAAAMTPTL